MSQNAKTVSTICGYIHEGNEAPDNCPQCKAPKGKFSEKVEGVLEWADEHKVGKTGTQSTIK